MVRLVKALRDCAKPDDEVEVAKVLKTLLVPPAISQQAAAKGYDAALVDAGFASVQALENLAIADLLVLGIVPGHAGQVLRALQVGVVTAPTFVGGDQGAA